MQRADVTFAIVAEKTYSVVGVFGVAAHLNIPLSSMSRKRFMCLDCDIDTGKIHEHYFVTTSLWLSAVGSNKGMLCVGCLEKRLSRKLTKADFPNVSINSPRYEPKSQRLLERMS